ncbi:MAG TPA: ribonuclease HII [Rubrobacter sp.]|nr:RNase [Rubrobacteraceae bacterium]HET6660295.1 ribonuclease HII [Rubrobacter sp.]
MSGTPPNGLPQEECSLYAFDAAWVLCRRGPLAGADEAGRGALAGPLVAAAVVLGGDEISGINDSKLLRPALRQEIFGALLRRAEAVSVVAYPAWWIDRHGVGLANREALRRALASLESRAGCGLADGNLALGPEVECLPRADARSAAVAAASVVAKVLRDDAMRALSETHTGYGFGRNRGYGTPEHRLALSELGPCRVHRFSYAGVGD